MSCIRCCIFAVALILALVSGGLCEETGWDVTHMMMRCEPGVRNPLKGLRANEELDTQYGSLVRWYIPWNEIENCAEDSVEKLLDYGRRHWKTANLKNCKIIPRVYLEWPGRGTYWPADMEAYDYTSDVFCKRLQAMIEKMAAAWDYDPQIAYIEMGLIGQWGEQHSPYPTEQVERILLESFQRCFRNKLIMVRYPQSDLFSQSAFGLHWDEWGSEMQWYTWDRINTTQEEPYKERWKTAVFGGENTNNLYTYASDGGRFRTYGSDVPFSAQMAFTRYYDQMINYARLMHTNHLYTRLGGLYKEGIKNAALFQDTLGYAFELQKVRFNHVDEEDRLLELSFEVVNTGASPMYEDWPVRVALLDLETNVPVWDRLIPECSVSEWMPGEVWQPELQTYEIPPQTYTIEAKFYLPDTIAAGSYVLALSIPDTAGLTNAAVFVNRGYIQGGYTALGVVGITCKPVQSLDVSGMPGPWPDHTLLYHRNIGLHSDCNIPELTDGMSWTVWRSDGTTIMLDLGRVTDVSGLTLEYQGEQPRFVIEKTTDGVTWEVASAEGGWQCDGEVHVPINEAVRMLRIAVQSDSMMTQIMVYSP